MTPHRILHDGSAGGTHHLRDYKCNPVTRRMPTPMSCSLAQRHLPSEASPVVTKSHRVSFGTRVAAFVIEELQI